MSPKISQVQAEEVLDLTGTQTVQAIVNLDDGTTEWASIPSGTSKSPYEAHELRDEEGSVKEAIKNIEELIKPKLIGLDTTNQQYIDNLMIELDGTGNKRNLGANAMLAVSLAVARAGAKVKNLHTFQYINLLFGGSELKIPDPLFNLIEGGVHAKNNLKIQEFLVLPKTGTFQEKFAKILGFFEKLKKKFSDLNVEIDFGLEGGLAPKGLTEEEILDILKEEAKDVFDLGLDAAGESSFDYQVWVKKYGLLSVEDPYGADQWDRWVEFTERTKNSVIIVADDLTATNPKRVQKVVDKEAATGLIIKPNQVGTLTETLEAIKLAKNAKMKIFASHRSKETLDSFIADLAVGVGADFIKAGAPTQDVRLAKYERLIEIEKLLAQI